MRKSATAEAAPERFAVRLDSGAWYQGKEDNGDPKWTRVPSWAYVFDDQAELGEFLEWLEESPHEYSLLRVK